MEGRRWLIVAVLSIAPGCAIGLTSADAETEGTADGASGVGGSAAEGSTAADATTGAGAGTGGPSSAAQSGGGAASSSSSGAGGLGAGGDGPASSSAASTGSGFGGAAVCDLSGCDVDEADPAKRCSGGVVIAPLTAPPGTQWAATVTAFSSEYGTSSWSAAQATGAPDSYPQHGDLTTAWCTSMPDSASDSITLEFVPPVAGSQVWVYETYNPDAVQTVTITTAMGDSIVYQVPASSVGGCAYVLTAATNTAEPVSHVKIDLAAQAVAGWNELDAVGIVP